MELEGKGKRRKKRKQKRKEGRKENRRMNGTVTSPRMTALEAESTAISELLFNDPFTKTLGTSIRMSPKKDEKKNYI